MADVVQTSPLLRRLSPELRNMIYEAALIATEDQDINTEQQQPGLIRTCREIRSEATAIYYHGNVFAFTTTSGGDDGLDPVTQWLRRIGPKHCRHLKDLHVQIGAANGIMLKDPESSESPWASLIKDMKQLGCCSTLDLRVKVYRDERLGEIFQRIVQRCDESASLWHDRLEEALDHLVALLCTAHLGRSPSFAYVWAQKRKWDVAATIQLCAISLDRNIYAREIEGYSNEELQTLMKSSVAMLKELNTAKLRAKETEEH